ncbi:MAG: hypothetical protein HN348_01385 [Proteobacteria bacterium]|nr:hypothetical protein [Pseudomonadota bacterium]
MMVLDTRHCRQKSYFACSALAALVACEPQPGLDDTDDRLLDSFCFVVDDEMGFNTLQEAVDEASDGSLIEICEIGIDANDPFEETVTISGKRLELIGSAITKTRWSAPINEPNLKIESGSDLTISNISFESTRSAIKIDDSTLNIEDAQIVNVNQWGIKATNSNITANFFDIQIAGDGGITATGGTLSATNITIDGATAYGFKLKDGVVANISSSTIKNLTYKGDGKVVEDGWAFDFQDDTEVTLEGIDMIDNALGGVNAENGLSLSLEDIAIAGGHFGVYVDNTPTDIVNIDIDGYYQYGVVALSTDLTIGTFSIVTDPEASAVQTDVSDGSIAILAQDSSLVATDGTVYGANGQGILQETKFVTALTATLDNILIDNSARIGLGLYNSTASVTDIDIKNTRSHETCEVSADTFACNFAMLSSNSAVTWTGGSVEDNSMWGLVTFERSLTISDVYVARNQLYGVYVQDAALFMDNATFEDGMQTSLAVRGSAIQAEGVVTNSSFTNGQWDRVTDTFDDQGNPIQRIDHNEGIDVFASAAKLEIADSTFSTGDKAIYAIDTPLRVTDSTFDNYLDTAIQFSADTKADVAEIDGVTMSNIGNYGVYCNDGTTNISDFVATDITEHVYWSEEVDMQGNVLDETIFSSYAPAIWANNCTLTADEVTIDRVWDNAIAGYNAQVKLTDIEIVESNEKGYANDGAIDFYNYTEAPDIFLEDIRIGLVHVGDGINIQGSTAYPGGNVEIYEVSLGDTTIHSLAAINSDGMYLQTLDTVTVSGFDFYNVAGEGMVLSDVTATITGDDGTFEGMIEEAGLNGISISSGSNITLSGITIKKPGSNGVNTNYANLTATNLTIKKSTAVGLLFNGGTHDLNTTNKVTDAGTWGMSCTNTPVFAACPTNLEGASGANSNCSCAGG